MNKLLLSFLIGGSIACGMSAETISQTMYFDFGSAGNYGSDNGDLTSGADDNGNYWNNITNSSTANKYAASGTVYSGLVNSANTETGYSITLNSRFSTNGKSGGGGLLSPSADLLGDLAIATATEDYFFIESSENNSNFTIAGLNPDYGYRFHIFASRTATDTRIGTYTMDGLNSYSGNLQHSGTGIGADGENQNTQNILISDLVFPNEYGNITFTVSRNTGAYIALNAMKIEEITNVERPVVYTYTSASLLGTATEDGTSTPMHLVASDTENKSLFECFTKLQAGGYHFSATTSEGTTFTFGVNDSKIAASESPADQTVDSEQLVMIRANFATGELTVTPISSFSIVGSATNGWSLTNQPTLEYKGNGVWKLESHEFTGEKITSSDPGRFIFVMNASWDYQMKALDSEAVAFSSDATVSDIRFVNIGTFDVTLDLRNFVYAIDSPNGIDENRISVMGSSVANGQGATDNQGYAYMYGQLQQQRSEEGLSDNAFYTSGISVNGNNTLNLLARYSDLTHDFGRYVIFGLSLGNEGIHGASDQQAIYDQFATNMQTLIQKARQDGKVPVIMNNYTRGDFNDSDYAYVRRMNLLINSWDLPSINLLGAIDNGSGNWADGYQATGDVYHPNDEGHTEFFYAMPPSLFDALKAGKEMPVRKSNGKFVMDKSASITITPENIAHSFALVLNATDIQDCNFVTITTESGNATIALADGQLTYTPADDNLTAISGTVAASSKAKRTEEATDAATTITLSHYYAQGRTLLYVNNTLLGEVSEKISPKTINVAPSADSITLSELMFYRSALNSDEVEAITNGTMYQSSLEVYLPFTNKEKLDINDAQTLNTPVIVPGNLSGIESISYNREATTPFKAVGGIGVAKVTTSTPCPIAIYTADGRLCHRQTVNYTANIPLPAGLYLINSAKVIVK